jgi:hypothetical protein
MQGCNPSAAPEAGAGGAWKTCPSALSEIMGSEGNGHEQSTKRNRQPVGGREEAQSETVEASARFGVKYSLAPA